MEESLSKLDASKNAKDTVSVKNNNNCDKACTIKLPETRFNKVKARSSNYNLKMDLSGELIFGPANLSNRPDFSLVERSRNL